MWVQRMRIARRHRRAETLAVDGGAAVAAAAHRAAVTPARVDARRRADGHRLAEAGRAAAGQRAGRADAAAARSDPRPRARAHPPARLPRQPAADARRDAALLSSRRVVAVAAHPHRARALLRRSRRQPLRRSGRLCRSARRPRGAARRGPDAGPSLAMAATGGSLLQRVRRLLGAPSARGPRPGWLAGLVALLLVVAARGGIAAGAEAGSPHGRSERRNPARRWRQRPARMFKAPCPC